MEALLQEALDEFDDDPAPAPPAEAATGSQLQPSPASAPTPVPETETSPPAPEPVLDAECDDLARKLMEGLNMGGAGDEDAADDMEQTLKALARSAETLAHDGGGPDPLELLKQMGLGDMGGLMGGAAVPEGGASTEQLDGLLDGLVGQLLSKEATKAEDPNPNPNPNPNLYPNPNPNRNPKPRTCP